MKKLFLAASGLMLAHTVFAADPASLKFGPERIGVPRLALSESIARSATTTPTPQLSTSLPGYSGGEKLPNLSPNLIFPTTPNIVRHEMQRSTRRPHVSRSSGMPIIEPSDAIDYKMTIVPPNPTIDFKLVLKDPPGPSPTSEQDRSK